jgi:hypothetical protein
LEASEDATPREAAISKTAQKRKDSTEGCKLLDAPVQWQENGVDAGKACRRIIKRLTNSQKVDISQKKGVYMFYDLNQDDSICLQFVI